MHLIPLEQVTPGMVLAEDVRLADGNLLLPKATVLTEDHLAKLRQRNAGEIAIEPTAPEPTSAEQEVTREVERETARNEVATLFRSAATDPINRALRQAVLEYRLEKIG